MNRIEAAEILKLPPQYRPLGPWAYFGYMVLFSIPLIGFISLIILSFSNSNINRRNFARSYFCFLVILLILGALIGLLVMPSVMESMQYG